MDVLGSRGCAPAPIIGPGPCQALVSAPVAFAFAFTFTCLPAALSLPLSPYPSHSPSPTSTPTTTSLTSTSTTHLPSSSTPPTALAQLPLFPLSSTDLYGVPASIFVFSLPHQTDRKTISLLNSIGQRFSVADSHPLSSSILSS